MHSNVEAESSPTAAPKRAASSSIRFRISRSVASACRSSFLPAWSALAIAAVSPSCVTEISSSFCSCICSEQSRPPSETHHLPLPRSWISLWRVCSMLSSMRTFLLSPTPVALTSFSTSRTSVGASAAASSMSFASGALAVRSVPPRMRCPLPPPPPIAFRRTRVPGCFLKSSTSRCTCQPSSVDRVEVDPLRVRRHEDVIGDLLEQALLVLQDLRIAGELLGVDEGEQRLARLVLRQERARGDVVHARRDAHADLERGPLRLVLLAGARLRDRVRADELEAGPLERGDELLVLGHEAVAGEHGVVAVVSRDPHDLVHPLDALLLRGPGVVRHAVHAARVGELAQLGRERVGVDDRVSSERMP